jgi:hypothetical protein
MRRYIPRGGAMVEVTTRTVQARHLLRPCEESCSLIRGVLGRALTLYPSIKVFGYWFLSNHYHMLLWAPDTQTLSLFMTHLNGNIAKEIGRLHGWRQKFWGRRYRAIVVCDSEAMIERLVYLLSQGCKEGLIDRPSAWPGVTCVRALREGTPDVGRWHDRSERHRREHTGETLDADDCSTVYSIPLAPLPCWAKRSVAWRKRRISSILSGIVRLTARINRDLRRRPLGVAAAICRPASFRPPKFSAAPAPACHASTDEVRKRFLMRYFRFVDRCRRATRILREGHPRNGMGFPRGAFVPRLPLVRLTQLAA